MTCIEGDSIQALHTLHDSPDVVVLDPMFPERTKSAAVKKKFQLLHKLERPCSDEAALLSAACSAHPKRLSLNVRLKALSLLEQNRPILSGVKLYAMTWLCRRLLNRVSAVEWISFRVMLITLVIPSLSVQSGGHDSN